MMFAVKKRPLPGAFTDDGVQVSVVMGPGQVTLTAPFRLDAFANVVPAAVPALTVMLDDVPVCVDAVTVSAVVSASISVMLDPAATPELLNVSRLWPARQVRRAG